MHLFAFYCNDECCKVPRSGREKIHRTSVNSAKGFPHYRVGALAGPAVISALESHALLRPVTPLLTHMHTLPLLRV